MALPESLPSERPSPTRTDVSHWQEEVWAAELDYEVRALKLVTRCARAEHNRILCGDKSGRVAALFFDDGRVDWITSPLGGPVYDLALVHPLEDASRDIDPEEQPLMAVGAGDDLTFLDYLDGRTREVETEDGPRAWLHLGSSILSLLYIESRRELWVGLAGGEIERLAFDFQGDTVRCRRLSPVPLGEGVSAFCFMPGSQERSGEGYRRGWICVATMLGNVYELDPSRPCPGEPILKTLGPIRACVSLSLVAAQYGWEGSDVFAVAYGGSVKYYIRPRPGEKPATWQESVLDWPCADRIFCLSWADLEDSVWLVVGSNDKRLHFCRVMSKEAKAQSPSHCFGDRRLAIKLDERVREIAVREIPEQGGANLYVALGDHRIQALHLLSKDLFRERIQQELPARDLSDVLVWLTQDPYDPVLRRNLISLLFRSGWLSDYLERQPLDAADERRLKLIVYHLLAGSRPVICRVIQSGILAAARRSENAAFRPLAVELARHIGKYCLDGLSFSDKTRNLDRLAEFNENNDREYLYDAAIYRSLLAERRHTERAVCELPYPITSLQAVDLPDLGGQRLLATSYHEGAAWLIEKDRWPRLTFETPSPEPWIQQIVVWTDPHSSARYAIFFYRDKGWTWCNLDELGTTARVPLPEPRRVDGKETFYIYSFSEALPGGLIAVGGRFADVALLRFEVPDGRPELRILQCIPAVAESRNTPVRAICFHPLEKARGEVFVGCDDGTCYRFPFNGQNLEKPHLVHRVPASIRAVTARGADHLILGDGSDTLTLLRRLDPQPEKGESTPAFVREWIARLNGAAITGLLETTLWVPSATEPSRDPEPRTVSVVSSSLGAVHVMDFGERREHSFALPLDGRAGRGSPPIDHMVLYPAEGAAVGETQVAVACFDKTVRVLRLIHRRESVQDLNKDLSRAIVAALRKTLDLSADQREKAEEVLRNSMSEQVFVVEVARRVAEVLVPADEQEVARLEEEIWGTFQEVAWKLASVNVLSESTTVMSLRLRYDDPKAFPRLLGEFLEMASGTQPILEGKRPHLRLRYWLRFAFKIIAHRLEEEDPPDAPLRRDLAQFVHACHDLCRSWGPDQSDDELRCKLAVSHMLFRYATRRTLECLLGNELDDHLQDIKGKSMGDFLKDLVDDTRLAISFRMVQHIRRMVSRDEGRNLRKPVVRLIAPLLVDRFRSCQFTHHDAWLGTEIYLCLHTLERQYGYSQWELVSALFKNSCSLPQLELLAERQRVLPPHDPRCGSVVEALNRAEGVSADANSEAAARQQVFANLNGEESQAGILACIRLLTAIAIGFDSSSDPKLRTQAHAAIERSDSAILSFPPLLPREEVEQLLVCAGLLIRLATIPTGEDREDIYRDLRRGLDRLQTLGDYAVHETGLLESDVIRKLFLESRELVQRQAGIEFDFVAPLRFLQEQSFAGTEFADEQLLSRKLLGYAALQRELSRAQTAVLLIKDVTAHTVIMDVLGTRRLHEDLPSRARIRQSLEALFPPPARIVPLQQEAARLLDAGPGDGQRLDLFEISSDLLGEIIPIDRDGERFGLLFFAFKRRWAPDPSKRALSRMIPQFLVIEYMRSVQRQRLLALTFHHISAPVAAMRAMLKSLNAGYIDREEQEGYFEKLWLMAEDCRLMIENHQNYSRTIRSIALPITPTRFDLVAEAEFRRKIVHYKYKGGKQTLRWTSPVEPLEVFLDQVMVGDIIQNLLDNACKYSPARSEIRLNIEGKRKEVFIEVADEGPGLPEHVSASMYGEGVRGETASQSTRPGLGLGLYMVHRYVERLDGAVWFASSPAGTTFTVRLPREVGHR